MPVCLHCGELANEGQLFCTKCGFTLPQVDAPAGGTVGSAPRAPSASGVPNPPTGVVGALPPPPPPPPPGTTGVPFVYPSMYPSGGYATLAPPVPGSVGPIPPPPAGKYCIYCRTIISRVAVYCPVCQHPQE